MRTAALVALSLSVVSPAHALDCAWGSVAQFPGSDAVDVPTNVVLRQILLSADAADAAPVLTDASGAEVPIEVELHAQGSETLVTLRPEAPLAAESTFSLSDASEVLRPISFTTGTAADEEPPELPAVLSSRREQSESDWGPTDGVEIELGAASEPVFYRLDLSSRDSGDRLGSVFTPPLDDAGSGHVFAGTSLCSDTGALDGAVNVAVIAIDLAGNESAVAAVEVRSGGCSSVGAPVGLGVGLLGLLAVGLRRRRR